MIDTTFIHPTRALSEQEQAAVDALEADGFFVSITAPGSKDIPEVFAAERGTPVRRQQSHTLTGLHRAVLSDLARRGETPAVAITTGLVGAASTPTPNGDQS